MSTGIYPARGPGGRDWRPDEDESRSALGGLPLCYIGAVVAVKGDWAEYAHTLGMPSWASALHPCPWCRCTKASMSQDATLTALNFPWPLKTHRDYDAACRAAEVAVVIRTVADRRLLVACLEYDARKDGARGRRVTENLNRFGLQAGDRLEPTVEMPDVSLLDKTKSFPIHLTFWRRTDQTVTLHRNPIFDDALGITISSLLVDNLHCFYLGVLKDFSTHAFWEMLHADCWEVGGHRTLDERVLLTTRLVSGELTAFYDQWQRERPHYPLTLIQEFSAGMVGSNAKRCLRLKASENKAFFFYLLSALRRRYRRMVRGDAWMAAATALDLLIDSMRACPLVPSPAAAQVHCALMFASGFDRHGGTVTQLLHQMCCASEANRVGSTHPD